MPYRLDVHGAGDDAFDRLVELGALDIESLEGERLAALLPDNLSPDQVAMAIGAGDVSVSSAVGRDADSVWVLSMRPVQVGTDALTLVDSAAFGTGLHPTTVLCLEALAELVLVDCPGRVLDVGTGSGVLALAALMRGISHATALDVDDEALQVAAENARANGLGARLECIRGGPDSITGTWPLVLANVAAAPLIEMASTLVRRVGHHGQLVLSGIPVSVEHNVHDTYRRLGMHRVELKSRGGWTALVLRASW